MARPGQVTPGQARPGQTRPGQAKPCAVIASKNEWMPRDEVSSATERCCHNTRPFLARHRAGTGRKDTALASRAAVNAQDRQGSNALVSPAEFTGGAMASAARPDPKQ